MDSTSIQFRSHTALLLAAALPFLQPAYRQPVELAMKFLELSETMKLYREFQSPENGPVHPLHKPQPLSPGVSGIMELVYRFVQDPEGLLHNLSPVCTGKEKEIVGMLLNLMQAKSFYETYGDMLKTFMSSESVPPTEPQSDTDFSMPDIASMMAGSDFSSMLNSEQAETLNLLKNLLNAD